MPEQLYHGFRAGDVVRTTGHAYPETMTVDPEAFTLHGFGRPGSEFVPVRRGNGRLDGHRASSLTLITPAPRPKASDDLLYNADAADFAAERERTIEFRYAKGSGAVIETRRLKPSEVVDNLIVGYDEDRKMPRAFRLDRIQGTVTIL